MSSSQCALYTPLYSNYTQHHNKLAEVLRHTATEIKRNLVKAEVPKNKEGCLHICQWKLVSLSNWFHRGRRRPRGVLLNELHPFPWLNHKTPGRLYSPGPAQPVRAGKGLRKGRGVKWGLFISGGVGWEGWGWLLNSSILSHGAGSNQLLRLERNSEPLLFALAAPPPPPPPPIHPHQSTPNDLNVVKERRACTAEQTDYCTHCLKEERRKTTPHPHPGKHHISLNLLSTDRPHQAHTAGIKQML